MPTNIVGSQVRKIRVAKGWSQATLSATCQRQGWDLARGTLAKLEAGIRGCSDTEVVFLALVLGVDVQELFPPKQKRPRA